MHSLKCIDVFRLIHACCFGTAVYDCVAIYASLQFVCTIMGLRIKLVVCLDSQNGMVMMMMMTKPCTKTKNSSETR